MRRRGVIAASAAAPAGFNPEIEMTWHSLFWAEGTDFQALGLSDTDTMTAWPNETDEVDADNTTGSIHYFDAVQADFNNQPVVDLGGVLYTDNFGTVPSYPISIVCIARVPAPVGFDRVLFEGNDCSNRNHLASVHPEGTWRMYAGGTFDDAGTYDSDPHLFVVTYDGSTGNDTLTIDGTLTIDADTGSQTLDGLTIGGNCNQQTASSADMALLGIYEGDITADAKWTDFVNWVEAHYGLSIA